MEYSGRIERELNRNCDYKNGKVRVTSGNRGQPICAFEWTSCQVTKVHPSHLFEYATGEITKEPVAPYLTRGIRHL